MNEGKHIYHKIRGSYPGYLGIELPNDYKVLLLNEDNFNDYRKGKSFQALYPKIADGYCHFQKPVDGSWYVLIESNGSAFNPSMINIIYKSIPLSAGAETTSSNSILPTANNTQAAAFIS